MTICFECCRQPGDQFAVSRLSCDSRMRKYERNRSRSSAEKTSSDESYFTDPDQQSSFPQPMPHPPLASSYPSPPSPLLHRQGSAVTHRTWLSDMSASRHEGCAPSSSSARRTSNLAPAPRSPSHDHGRKHSNAECESTVNAVRFKIRVLWGNIFMHSFKQRSAILKTVSGTHSMYVGPTWIRLM